eukprot:169424-Amphidinium_carterae.1
MAQGEICCGLSGAWFLFVRMGMAPTPEFAHMAPILRMLVALGFDLGGDSDLAHGGRPGKSSVLRGKSAQSWIHDGSARTDQSTGCEYPSGCCLCGGFGGIRCRCGWRFRHLFTLAQTLTAVGMKRSIEDETRCKMPGGT